MKLSIKPITLKAANEYVNRYHRHHDGTRGCKFAISVYGDDDELHGVAICGRPVGRYYDDGVTLEINRVCTDGTPNACSKLYGVCCRIAKEMGYSKVITYTLQSENGASLKASNFVCEGTAGGTHWTGQRNNENKDYQLSLFDSKSKPAEMKRRWVRRLTDP